SRIVSGTTSNQAGTHGSRTVRDSRISPTIIQSLSISTPDGKQRTDIHIDGPAGLANDPAWKYFLLNRLGNEMEFLYVSVHAPRKLRNVGRFHGNDPTAATLRSVAHVLHVHSRSAFLRDCK